MFLTELFGYYVENGLRGLKMVVALERDDAGLAQGGGIGDKEKWIELRHISEIESIRLMMRVGGKRSQSDPQISGSWVNGSTIYFTGKGNSEGGVNLWVGKIKRSVLVMLMKTSIWW